MEELAMLAADEQLALAALKALQARRKELQQHAAEQAALEAQLQHDALATKVAQLRPVTVLNASYESVRRQVKDEGLRVIKVHKDVLDLLHAALPAKDEQHFGQLVAALVMRLSSGDQLRLHAAIDELTGNSDTAHYFNEPRDASIAMVLTGRVGHFKVDKVSEMITAWALSWGSATHFEEKE